MITGVPACVKLLVRHVVKTLEREMIFSREMTDFVNCALINLTGVLN